MSIHAVGLAPDERKALEADLIAAVNGATRAAVMGATRALRVSASTATNNHVDQAPKGK